MKTNIQKIYNSDVTQRRLQAFIRIPETLQGLACVPYRGESGFIDRVLQEWFVAACHPHSVEEMMESGELSQIILSFLNGETTSAPIAPTVQRKVDTPLRKESPAPVTQPTPEPPKAQETASNTQETPPEGEEKPDEGDPSVSAKTFLDMF